MVGASAQAMRSIVEHRWLHQMRLSGTVNGSIQPSLV